MDIVFQGIAGIVREIEITGGDESSLGHIGPYAERVLRNSVVITFLT